MGPGQVEPRTSDPSLLGPTSLCLTKRVLAGAPSLLLALLQALWSVLWVFISLGGKGILLINLTPRVGMQAC